MSARVKTKGTANEEYENDPNDDTQNVTTAREELNRVPTRLS